MVQCSVREVDTQMTRVGSELVKAAQSCPTLCDPMDYTVHGILQARILEWEAVPFSRGSSKPRDWTHISRIEGTFFTSWVTREAQEYRSGWSIPSPADLPDPGVKPGSPALQADSLPPELSGKPKRRQTLLEIFGVVFHVTYALPPVDNHGTRVLWPSGEADRKCVL